MNNAHLYTDSTLILSDDQAVTATALSTNVINTIALGTAGAVPGATRNQGIPVGQTVAQPRFQLRAAIPILIQCTVTATSGGASTVTVTLESDTVATMDDDPTIHWTSGAIGKAALVAGYVFSLDHLPEGAYGQYLALRYTVATANLTAGKFHAEIGRGSTSGDRGYW